MDISVQHAPDAGRFELRVDGELAEAEPAPTRRVRLAWIDGPPASVNPVLVVSSPARGSNRIAIADEVKRCATPELEFSTIPIELHAPNAERALVPLITTEEKLDGRVT